MQEQRARFGPIPAMQQPLGEPSAQCERWTHEQRVGKQRIGCPRSARRVEARDLGSELVSLRVPAAGVVEAELLPHRAQHVLARVETARLRPGLRRTLVEHRRAARLIAGSLMSSFMGSLVGSRVRDCARVPPWRPCAEETVQPAVQQTHVQSIGE